VVLFDGDGADSGLRTNDVFHRGEIFAGQPTMSNDDNSDQLCSTITTDRCYPIPPDTPQTDLPRRHGLPVRAPVNVALSLDVV